MSPKGEKRAGGRPAIPEEQKRQTLTCRVSPDTKAWLDDQKAKSSKGIGEIVDLGVSALQAVLASKKALTVDEITE